MAAFLVAMTGCQKDEPQNEPDQIAAGEKVYMELKIQAVDTRSGTDAEAPAQGGSNSDATPDHEVGKDYENTISSVDVVLRNADKFIVASNVTPSAKDDAWLATFNSGTIAAGEKYFVYIYANCSASQNLDATSKATIEEITGISGTGDGKTGKFWMTNAYTATEVEVGALSTDKDKPTMLGSHFVERSMARFDYMATKTNNVYELTDKNAGITVTLTHAAIINQSKEFYLLRHATVSGNSTDNNNVVVGYPEIASNYVVDTDWTAKSAAFNSNPKNYSTIVGNFDYHLTSDYKTWPWKSLSSLSEDDNWTGTAGGATGIKPDPTHNYEGYKIFGYVKENTLPDVNSQVNGMSTGVVFKGQITDNGTDGVVTTAAGADIYMFDGKLYGVWDNVVEAAKTSEVLQYYVDKFGDDETVFDDDTYAALAAAGFTRYSAETDGNYYAYYYYWNRHNDNKDNKAMGAMEFAVVRNNVYKLCVDYINKLGHPVPGNDDPDSVDNDDPDESGEYYFGVSVKVVPWVVRVNHIGW